jgi:O-antigen/teichoic acid export membrane protein
MAREAMATTERQAGVADSTPSTDRFVALEGRNLREHAARGTIVNSVFQLGMAGLGLLRRLVIAAFLTQSQFGLWGIVLTTVMTLSWLKQIGVADKYVQQNEDDQEAAFQKAFTMELLVSSLFFLLVAVALPAYAVAYGQPAMIVPGLVLALSVPLSAFESPIWIPYRRMQFVRQRVLSAVDPVLVLAVLGAGYWSLVLGVTLGSLAGGIAATLTCPYPLKLRLDRQTARSYANFSWPLFGLGLSTLVVVQGALLVSNRAVGLAGVGAIGLAASITSFADSVDGIISQALYPAVCAVAHRKDKLLEAFVKSNRLALLGVASFALVTAPLILAFGLTGYALGWGALVLIQVAGRCWYMARLFDGFNIARHLGRSIAPSVPAAAAVLLVRLAESGHRTPAMLVCELVLYALVTVGATLTIERSLIGEVTSYLRGRARPAPAV